MEKFDCLAQGTHELSARKIPNGVEVTFDGRVKTILPPKLQIMNYLEMKSFSQNTNIV
jgi:hypothetical protein